MPPEWFHGERRKEASPEETQDLVWRSLERLSIRAEEDREGIRENHYAIRRLDDKVDRVLEHVETHENDSRQILESLRFSRTLRRWAFGVIAGVVLIIGGLHQGTELWQHLKEVFNKP